MALLLWIICVINVLCLLNRFKPSSKIFYWPFQGGTSFVYLLWFFLSCVCYAFVSVCWHVLCGHLLGMGWPLGSRLWCPTVSLLLSHWYPGSGVVLDCTDSWSLHPYLLCHAFVSVNCCLVATCWEKADLLALVCDVYCDFITFPYSILRQVWYLIVSIPDHSCLSYYENKGDQFINRIVAIDETWLHIYELELKSESSKWHTPSSLKPAQFRRTQGTFKQIVMIAYDKMGIGTARYLSVRWGGWNFDPSSKFWMNPPS